LEVLFGRKGNIKEGKEWEGNSSFVLELKNQQERR
jgi:hypothetical protein